MPEFDLYSTFFLVKPLNSWIIYTTEQDSNKKYMHLLTYVSMQYSIVNAMVPVKS